MSSDFDATQYAIAIDTCGEPAMSGFRKALQTALGVSEVHVCFLLIVPFAKHDASSVLASTKDLSHLREMRDNLNITIASLEGKGLPQSLPPGTTLQ